MQRALPLRLATALAALITSSIAQAGNPYLLDQRDPQYQRALEHLASAAQALSIARKELSLAQDAYHLPGLNVLQMQEQLVPLEDTLQVLLSPEKKRQAHQTLVPDGLFFYPIKTGE